MGRTVVWSALLVCFLLVSPPAAGLLQVSPTTSPTAPALGALPVPALRSDLLSFFADPAAVVEPPSLAPPPVVLPAFGLGPFDYVPRPPIAITSDRDFTPANGVVAGRGTASDPYVISGWEIDGSIHRNDLFGVGVLPGTGILISGTTAHVLVTGNYLHGHTQAAVFVNDARNVRIEGNLVVVDNPNAPPTSASPAVGIASFYGWRGTIDGNQVEVNGDRFRAGTVGIYLQEAWDLRVGNNTVVNTGNYSGIFVGLYDYSSGYFDTRTGLHDYPVTFHRNNVTNVGVVGSFLGLAHLFPTKPLLSENRACNLNPGALSQALFVRYGREPTLIGNDVCAGRAGGTAAWILQTNLPYLVNNTFRDSTYGLLVQETNGTFMREAAIRGNTYNFGLYGVEEPHFVMDANNTTNRIDGRPLVYLRESPTDRFVSNRTIDAGAYGAGWFGILRATNTTVVNLTTTASVQGGLFVGLRESRIVNVSPVGNLRGIEVALSNNTTVRGYNGSYVAFNGGHFNRLENSTLWDGEYGVRFFLNANANRVVNVLFQNLTYGVTLNTSTGNNVSLSEFIGNKVGVLVEDLGAGGNTFHHNNFLTRLRHHFEVTRGRVNATENHWGHAGGPTVGVPGANVDVALAQGGEVIALRPSDTPYPGAGPVP